MKYLIELEEETFEQNNDPIAPTGTNTLWRAKGFNTLVFDANGLRKLEKYREPFAVFETNKEYQRYFAGIEQAAYERGLKDGYEKCLQEHEFATAGQFAREEDIYREGWKKGVEEAWGAARCLVESEWPERREISGAEEGAALWDIFNSMDGETAIASVKAYNKHVRGVLEINAGDEVIGPDNKRYVAIGINGVGEVCGIRLDGDHLSYQVHPVCSVRKTGKSFPELVELFKIQEE